MIVRRAVGALIVGLLATGSAAAVHPAWAGFKWTTNASLSVGTGSLAAPGSPTAVRGTCVPVLSVAINAGWAVASNASGYVVRVGTTAGGPYPTTVVVSGGSSTSATVSGLAFSTRYFVVVAATRGGWTSPNSTEVSVVTPTVACV